MKNYVKIKTDKTLMNMPELYKASWDIRNDEETKDFLCQARYWLLRKDTPQPEYDPETQYVTSYYEEQYGYAVQVWEIHDKELPLVEEVEENE